MLSRIFLCTLLTASSGTNLEEKVFRNLVRLCPEQYVPWANNTDNTVSSEDASCCTESYKYSSQGYIETVRSDVDTTNIRCLFATTGSGPLRYMTDQSFYIVTRPPTRGCMLTADPAENNITNTSIQPTCNDSEVIPFRRFLPVYSATSGLIYKNPNCASCYGHHHVKMWQAHVTCTIAQAFSSDPNACHIDFVYPGNDADIQHLACFTNSFNKCPNTSVRIPPNIDLSYNELVEACSMEHLPKFTHAFFAKNVFCYICMYCKLNEDCFQKCLRPVSTFIDKQPGARFFTRIIDTRMMSEKIESKTGRPKIKTICGLDENEEVCHAVLCPLGQEMLDDGDEMKCQMESTKWQVSMFDMTLLLELDHTMNVNGSAISEMFTRAQYQSPWPIYWQIFQVHVPVERNITVVDVGSGNFNISNGRPIESVTHVYLKLHYKYNTVVNTAKFVADIRRALSKPWYLNIEGKTYRGRQALSRYSLRVVKAFLGQGKSEYVVLPFWQLAPDVEPYESVRYKMVSIKEIFGPQYNIKKLMLCKQVELASKNFNITYSSSQPMALFYRKLGTWLLDCEFTNGFSMTGENTFRVCVSDALRKPPTSGYSFTVTNHLLLLSVVFSTTLNMLNMRPIP